MDLYKETIIRALEKEEMRVSFSNLYINADEIVEMTCYRALNKIRDILHDESLEDDECFMQIEEIIRVFEKLGSNGGFRHDFG